MISRIGHINLSSSWGMVHLANLSFEYWNLEFNGDDTLNRLETRRTTIHEIIWHFDKGDTRSRATGRWGRRIRWMWFCAVLRTSLHQKHHPSMSGCQAIPKTILIKPKPTTNPLKPPDTQKSIENRRFHEIQLHGGRIRG